MDKHIRTQCRVVTFQWAIEDLTSVEINDDELLSLATPLDVSSRLSECSYSKTLDGPTGTFSFTLENDRNWMDFVKRGQWCLIYLTNEGDLDIPSDVIKPNVGDLKKHKNRLRCMGLIDRVSIRGVVQENGALDVVFSVVGRDHGVVYADTEIWQNFFESEKSVLDASNTYLKLNDIETVDQLMTVVHQLMYSPLDLNFKPEQKFTTLGLQWLLPKSLVQALGLTVNGGRPPFYGNLNGILEFSPTAAGRPVESPLNFLNGNAWSQLRSISIEPFHELFTELNNAGEPRLYFRPIPWATNRAGYHVLSPNIKSMRDLANDPGSSVALETIDIVDFEFGEDTHSIYNHFFTYLQTALYSTYSSVDVLLNSTSSSNRQFPYLNSASLRRYGFRPMHTEVNSLTEINEKSDAKPDERLLIQYNELMYDYYKDASYYLNGTMDIIGRNDVRVGKVLVLPTDSPYTNDKVFYIEGYEDRYVRNSDSEGDDEWSQTLQLTRGVNRKVLEGKELAHEKANTITRNGEFTRSGK